MTKKDFEKYKRLPKDIAYHEWKITSLEREAAKVPTVKIKVQSSQKEWPYIQTHETVDAPEPKRYTKLQREIRRHKRLLATAEKMLDDLTEMLTKIEDSRTRQIMAMRYIDGMKIADIVAKVDLTDRHVQRIIEKAIEKF